MADVKINDTSTITAKLPFKVKFLGISILKYKTVGFKFTNLTKFFFFEKNKLADSVDFNSWIKEHGNDKMLADMLFCAYEVYCQTHLKKPEYNESQLMTAIGMADDETKKAIGRAWENSNAFGKKKAKSAN